MNMAATMKMKVGGTTVGGKAVSRSVGEKILRKKGEGSLIHRTFIQLRACHISTYPICCKFPRSITLLYYFQRIISSCILHYVSPSIWNGIWARIHLDYKSRYRLRVRFLWRGGKRRIRPS